MTDFLWICLYVAIGTGAAIAVLYYAKPWFQGHRTQIFSGLVGLVGVLETADLSFMPDKIEGPLYLSIAFIGFFLRQITTTPVGEKE